MSVQLPDSIKQDKLVKECVRNYIGQYIINTSKNNQYFIRMSPVSIKILCLFLLHFDKSNNNLIKILTIRNNDITKYNIIDLINILQQLLRHDESGIPDIISMLNDIEINSPETFQAFFTTNNHLFLCNYWDSKNYTL